MSNIFSRTDKNLKTRSGAGSEEEYFGTHSGRVVPRHCENTSLKYSSLV